jgi:hypothetical protein
MIDKSSTRTDAVKKTAGQVGKTRRIHWVIESDRLDNLGHGVQFLHDELQHENPNELRSQHAVAFLEGFNWRGGSSATVRLLGSHPTFIAAEHWAEIIESTREAVLVFLPDEANLNYAFSHGPIHIIING